MCTPRKVPTFVDYMPTLTLAPPATAEPIDALLYAEFGGFCEEFDGRISRMMTWPRALALLKLQSEHIAAMIALGSLKAGTPPTQT